MVQCHACCYYIYILLPYIFIIGALATFNFKRQQEIKYAENARLYKLGKTACIDIDITNAIKVGDLVKGQCISFKTNFKHIQETCATDLIKDATCGKCIYVDQIIESFIQREVRECRTVQGRLVTLAMNDTETIQALERKTKEECTTRLIYEWSSGSSYNGLNAKKYAKDYDNFHFKPLVSEPVGYVPWISTKSSLDKALLETESKSKLLTQKCISNTFAHAWSTEVVDSGDGYTNTQYNSIVNGDSSKIKNCGTVSGSGSVGVHKLTGYCHGGEADSIRVVGAMNYTDDTEYQFTDWSDKKPEDVVKGPHHKIIVWDANGNHTMEDSLDDAAQKDRATIADIVKKADRGIYAFIFFALIFFIMQREKCCTKMDDDHSISSGSS